jgi:hypothetical protein
MRKRIMNSTTDQVVTLKVHLSGAVAYVPDPDGLRLWALLPNGLQAAPAPWSSTTSSDVLKARSQHFAFILVDSEFVNKDRTTARISSRIEPWDAEKLPAGALYPLTANQKALSLIVNRGLDFQLTGDDLRIKKKVKRFVPKMKKISPLHSFVDRHYLPGSDGFRYRDLSAAFCLNTGVLKVERFFGEDQQTKVDFGRVIVTSSGDLNFEDRVWKKRLANHLIWKAKLPPGQRDVIIRSIDWSQKSQDECYVLTAPENRNEIDIAITNTEVDVLALFLEDPVLPAGKAGFPDPDFELFYGLSVNQGQPEQRRFPVPNPQTAGKVEKPCTDGLFVGFS